MVSDKLTQSEEMPKPDKHKPRRSSSSNASHILSNALKNFATTAIKTVSGAAAHNRSQKPLTVFSLPHRSKKDGGNMSNSSSFSIRSTTEEVSLSANTIVQRVSAESKQTTRDYQQAHSKMNTTSNEETNRNMKHQIQSQLLIVRECKEIVETFMKLQENCPEARQHFATAATQSEFNLGLGRTTHSFTSSKSVELDLPASMKSGQSHVALMGSVPDTAPLNYKDTNAVFIEIMNKLYHLNDQIPQMLLSHYSRHDRIYKKQMLRLFGDSYYHSQYAVRAFGPNHSHNAESATDARPHRSEKDAKYYKNYGKRHNRYIGKYSFEELLNRKEATIQLCQAFVEAKHSFIYEQGNSLCIRHTPEYYASKTRGQMINLDSSRRSYTSTKPRSKSQSFAQFKNFTKTSSVDKTEDGSDKTRRDSLTSTVSDDAKDVVFNVNRSHFSERNLIARRQAASMQLVSPLQITFGSGDLNAMSLRLDEVASVTHGAPTSANTEAHIVDDDRSYKLRAMDAMMRLNAFDFDVFEFDILTNGQSLSTLFPIMMEQLLFFDSGTSYGLRDSLTGQSVTSAVSNSSSGYDNSASSKNNEMIFNQDIVLNMISKIENQYHDFNPFYNRIHTAQMLCDCYFWLNQFDSTMINSLLKQEDRLIILISSLIINLGYPGVDNSMLVEMNHDLSRIYNNQFVTENYAIAQFFYLLKHPSLNIFGNLMKKNKNKFKQIKKKIIQAVINSNQSQRNQLTKGMKESIDVKQSQAHSQRLREIIGSREMSNDGTESDHICRNKSKNGQLSIYKKSFTRFQPVANLFKNLKSARNNSASDLSAIALPADIADASKPDILFTQSKGKKLKKLKKMFSPITRKSRMKRHQSKQQKSLTRQTTTKSSAKGGGSNASNCIDDIKRQEKEKEILRDAIVHTSKYGYFCKHLELHKEWSERYFQQHLISSNVFDQMMHGTDGESTIMSVHRAEFPFQMIENFSSDGGFDNYFQAFVDFIDSKQGNTILVDMAANKEHWTSGEKSKDAYQSECARAPSLS